MFTDIAASGEEVLAAGSDAQTTHAFRLGAGGDPNNAAAWQQLDPAKGREPALAGLPGTFAVMLEPSGPTSGSLFVQRLEGAAWSPRVALIPAVNNNGYQLAGSTHGRLTAVINYSAYRLVYMTSTDGGVLWSSDVNIGNFDEYPSGLQVSTNATGAGAAVFADAFGAKAVHLTRFTPRTAPVARRRFRRVGARMQVRSTCSGDKQLSLVVEAARGNRRVAPSTVLRRASFRSTRSARRGFRSKFRARYTLRRRTARIPVRVTPRRGKARTLRLRVRALQRDALMFELNPPNILTLIRVALIPVLVAILLSTLPESDLLAAIVFVIASATDALDGYIARRRSMVTAFGKLMDPLADKLLITAALVSLVALYRLDAWVAMVIIAREFAVTGLRMLAIEQGQVISASGWGKLKTVTQVAMVLALIWVDRPAPWVDILIYVTVAITVLSGVDYFYRLRKLFAPQPAAPSSHSRIET